MSTNAQCDRSCNQQPRGSHQYPEYRYNQKQYPSEPDVNGGEENRIERRT